MAHSGRGRHLHDPDGIADHGALQPKTVGLGCALVLHAVRDGLCVGCASRLEELPPSLLLKLGGNPGGPPAGNGELEFCPRPAGGLKLESL